MKQWHKQIGFLVIAIFCAFISYVVVRVNHKTTSELAIIAEQNLHKKEKIANKQLAIVNQIVKQSNANVLFKRHEVAFNNLYKDYGIAIYAYSNDSLVFWSDNQPPIDFYNYSNQTNVQLLELRNGWYEYIKQTDSVKHTDCVALILLKPKYDFENKYLNNNFSHWLDLPDNTILQKNITSINYAIKSISGMPLFEIRRNDGLYVDEFKNDIACIFFYLAIIFFSCFLYNYFTLIFKNRTIIWLVTAGLTFIAISALTYFKFPSIVYASKLYDPKIFADASSFYFGFMGDVLFNSFIIFLFSVFVYKIKHDVSSTNSKLLFSLFGVIFIGLLYFGISISHLIYSLTNNSTISYNINELFDFSIYSLLGYTSVALLMFAFYLCVEKLVMLILLKNTIHKPFLIFFFISVVILYVYCTYHKMDVFCYLWTVPLYITSYLLRKYKASYNFINIGLIILFTTIIISNLFFKYENENKIKTYEALSNSLEERQDVIAENEFIKIANSIKSDVKIKNLMSFLPLSAEKLEETIRQLNFSGYFERYEIILSLFKSDCSPVFKMENQQYLNEEYFLQQIEKKGSQTICDELFYINIDQKPIRYIAKIPIEDISLDKKKTHTLYIQLDPKLANNIGVFPDLLLDKSLENRLQMKNISYAVYSYNKLQNSYGEFQYPIFYSRSFFQTSNSSSDDFNHYTYNVKTDTEIIISETKSGIWNRFTSNSYLFIFFSFIVLAGILVNSIIIRRNFKFNSLNNRIQFIFVFIVFLSLTGVVLGTVWVVNSQLEKKNKSDLLSKAQLVYKELEDRIGNLNKLENSYKDFTSYTLKKQSVLFSTDITLFTKDGLLFTTSQPTIYEQGLISKLMNPVAFSAFAKNNQVNFSHRENIGKLNYLSVYIPFYNTNDKLLGYINLPYFSRQKDLEKELTAYLTTLLNIYTILFALSALVALLVSNLLTKPLRIIKQQISKIEFDKPNESLLWQSNDEIGKLVSEYNTMLIKLEKSSELLAKSERESAWREMAKQVAHEIKNPLTPMKLNIQHLQRVAQTHPEDMAERIDKVSKMLIEQIDTLSRIATEFSNFAMLPKEKLESVNITEVLQNITQLFIQNSNCEINLQAETSLFILADKDQCIRIFTNLLKNAEQSIPENRKGKIDILLNSDTEFIMIEIRDNGAGIPENIQDKLFTPNFTTKTTGTGLGLAMVKNSVTSFNGKIDFKTELNVGTTFMLLFPKI